MQKRLALDGDRKKKKKEIIVNKPRILGLSIGTLVAVVRVPAPRVTFAPLRVSTQSDEEVEIMATPTTIVLMTRIAPPVVLASAMPTSTQGKVLVSSRMGTAPSASSVLGGVRSFSTLRGVEAPSSRRGVGPSQGFLMHCTSNSYTRIDDRWVHQV